MDRFSHSKTAVLLPPGPFQPSKISFFVSLGRFSHHKIACLPSWDVSAIKQQHFCFPGAVQPSKSSIVGPWAVAAIKKQHFWLLGSFSYQKTAFLAPGPFQPSKNSMFASLGWFNHRKTALLAFGAFHGVSAIKEQQVWLWGRFNHQTHTHIHTQHPPVAINTKCN